jgi:8-oxo-dGTP pyrophosphatase MutT (NUDIX family)
MKMIRKVTAFIIREQGKRPELLLFEHPHAGIQIPAGTVDQGETPEQAVVREIREETGFENLHINKKLGTCTRVLPGNQRIIALPTKVFARPNTSSFDWAYLRTGIQVTITRKIQGFSQILYQEFDNVLEPNYESLLIKGWVPDDTLADSVQRYFYLVSTVDSSRDSWTQFADHHTFSLFWSPLDNLPQIIHPQDAWLDMLKDEFSQVNIRN